MKWSLILLFATIGCATGPRPNPAIAKIRTQASFELQCDSADITITKISDDIAFMGVKNQTWGVRGCGRQVIYKSSCGLGSCQVLTETQARYGR